MYLLTRIIRNGIKLKSKFIIRYTLLLSNVRIDFEQKILRDSSLDNKSKNKINVKTKTLDHLLKDEKSIGLIKLEAEGHEPEVLEGSLETLKKTKYITVDVGPERNHKSTFDSVHLILTNASFQILEKGKIRETVLYFNQALVNH